MNQSASFNHNQSIKSINQIIQQLNKYKKHDRPEMIKASIFFLLVEDCYQYFVHRAMHWGPLYKHIHKIHHKFAAPFGICAEYAHPLETLILGLGFFIGPLIWTAARGMHVFTMAVWLAVRLIQTVDAHSGYDFPWSLHHYIPFWAGAEFHDYHHQVLLIIDIYLSNC